MTTVGSVESSKYRTSFSHFLSLNGSDNQGTLSSSFFNNSSSSSRGIITISKLLSFAFNSSYTLTSVPV
ncbi:hypothetical protein HanIR_Chr17g0854511 [Helianthus annuus]|nr:hypothetical protein HanIR_Chr17g0854511 [Helianthus annuus]